MAPLSLPPRRPKPRAMLDAATQERVSEARYSDWRGEHREDLAPEKTSARERVSEDSQPLHPPASASGISTGSRSSTKSTDGPGRVKADSRRRPAGNPKKSAPSSGRGRIRRKPIRVHSRKDRAKWTLGGLTISVRALVAGAITIVLLITLVPLGLQWMKQEQAYRAVVAEVAAAESTNDAMREELAEWENEDFIAAKARERLGYVRPGETQFVVIDAPESEDVGKEDGGTPANIGPPKPWMWHVAETLQDVDVPPSSAGLSGPEEDGVGADQ